MRTSLPKPISRIGVCVVASIVFCSGCYRQAPSGIDYSQVEQREAILCEIAHSDYPENSHKLACLLRTGGALAFRDYLLYLNKLRPNEKDLYFMLPLSLGRQPPGHIRDSKGRIVGRKTIASPSFKEVVDVGPLTKAGLFERGEVCTYSDLAVLMEKTLCHWEVVGTEDIIAGDLGPPGVHLEFHSQVNKSFTLVQPPGQKPPASPAEGKPGQREPETGGGKSGVEGH